MQPGANSTARRSIREPATLPVTLLVGSRLRETEYRGYTVDISLEGARIRSGVRLKRGQVIAVVPAEGRGFAVWSRVIWVGSSGTDRAGLAGLEFLPKQHESVSGWKA